MKYIFLFSHKNTNKLPVQTVKIKKYLSARIFFYSRLRGIVFRNKFSLKSFKSKI